jgi:hypothetical protein
MFLPDIPNRTLSPSKFQKYMGKFLYSPFGSKHRAHFKLDGNFSCGDTLPPIKVQFDSTFISNCFLALMKSKYLSLVAF